MNELLDLDALLARAIEFLPSLISAMVIFIALNLRRAGPEPRTPTS